MKIKKVKIKNFRCFEDITISNIHHTQGIIGENATGKTAILEAINLVTSPGYTTSKIDESDFNNKDLGNIRISIEFDSYYYFLWYYAYHYYRQIPCKKVSLEIKRRERSTGKALSDEFVTKHCAVPKTYLDKSHLDLGEEQANENIPDFVKYVEEDKNFILTIRSGEERTVGWRDLFLRNDNTKKFPNVFYFDKDREREAKVGYNSLLSRIAKDLNWRYYQNANLTSDTELWENYYRSVISAVENEKNRRIIYPLQEQLQDFLGRTYNQIELSLLNLEHPFKKSFFSQRSPGTANQIPVENMGSGIYIALALFLSKTVSELSKESIIILIDEPELHLHPQAQKTLFRTIQELNYQIIYTTHSDIFVDLAEWKGIKRLNSAFDLFPRQIMLETEFQDEPLRTHLQDIKNYYRDKTIYLRENNELLFARKCLLVEGAVDKFAVQNLSLLMGYNFSNVTIIDCHSKSKIPDYQILGRAFGIDFFTLYDQDQNKEDFEEAHKSLNEELEEYSLDEQSFSFETSLDDLLRHKGSAACDYVDSIDDLDEIDEEILEAIEKINNWNTV